MAEQAQIIRWEEPPAPRGNPRPPGRSGSRYDRIAVDLIAAPGRSGVVYEGASHHTANNLAFRIRRGEISSFAPGGDFDACVRIVDDVPTVYARYLGHQEESNA